MEILRADFFTVLVSVLGGLFSLASVLFIYTKFRKDTYDLILKKAQIESMRRSYEGKIYDLTDDLTSSSDRWMDVNHLVVAGQKGQQSKVSSKEMHAPFFNNLGVNVRDISEVKNRVFVLTPFHSRFDSTYKTIKETCIKAGFTCSRGDEEFRSGAILGHIVEGMLGAGIIIANINGRNPNVYYELGIAHSLGKKVILVTNSLSEVPFDLQSQRIIIFRNERELEQNLAFFLAKTLVESI
ncbi:hypothetical protein D3C87_1414960 [compost metagenome]